MARPGGGQGGPRALGLRVFVPELVGTSGNRFHKKKNQLNQFLRATSMIFRT
jgi:hypothetical protein